MKFGCIPFNFTLRGIHRTGGCAFIMLDLKNMFKINVLKAIHIFGVFI